MNEVRFARARLKERVRRGEEDPLAVIAAPPNYARNMQLREFLPTIKYIGRTRTIAICRLARVKETRTLSDLRSDERVRLIELLRNGSDEIG